MKPASRRDHTMSRSPRAEPRTTLGPKRTGPIGPGRAVSCLGRRIEPRAATSRRRAVRLDSILTACLTAIVFLVPSVGAQIDAALTTPVRQTLHGIQEDWQAWQRGYYQNDREGAAGALRAIRASAADLGFERLPELSAAAAAYAAQSAGGGNYSRAEWALEDARTLDSSRPETHFAASSVAWRRGGYVASATSLFRGYVSLLRLESTRTALLHNLFIALMIVVLGGGALMVAVQMAVRGGDVLHDLGRFLPFLPKPLLLVVGAAVLLWPLILPFGVVWLLLYWIVLLLGYVSASERIVLAILLLVLGATPMILQSEQRSMELATSPPARLLQAIENSALYGRMFSDLEVLGGVLEEDSAVLELEADLHRRLGQWELARARYGSLLEIEPANAAVLNNLGVYSHRKQDFGGAKVYFERAGEAEPQMVEAFFNLSQALSRDYFFGKSHEALAQAQALDRGRVDQWLELADADLAIGVEGSRARYQEIRSALVERSSADRPQTAWWSRLRGEPSILVTFGLLLVAVVIHLVRWRFGYALLSGGRGADRGIGSRLRRALIPGWRAIQQGHGVRAFLASALFVALISLPISSALRYRIPIDFDAGSWPLLLVGGIGLLLFVLFRVSREFVAERRS